MAKKRKKKKSNSLLKVLILIIVLVIIVGAGVYFVYPSYQKSKDVKNELETIEKSIDDLIPNQTILDLDFSKINGEFYDVTIISNDKSIINENGKVTRPSYKEGNKIVTIEIKLTVKSVSGIDKFVFNTLKIQDKTIRKTITVECLPKTDLDKVEEVLEAIKLPTYLIKGTSFPTEVAFYPEMSIKWKTSNPSVISETGSKIANGEATLTATVTLNDVSKSKDFVITSIDEYIINEIDYDFSDYEDDYYSVTTYDKILLNSSKAENESIKFKVTENEAYLQTNELIKKAKEISFNYKYADSETSALTKKSYIKILTSKDNIEYTEIYCEELVDREIHNLTFDLKGLDCHIKVLLTSEYKEKFIALDNLKITRYLNEDDIIQSIAFPNTLKESTLLPFTSMYGGTVKISSTNDALTSDGIVKRVDNSQEVTLQVQVLGFDFEIKYEKIIKVSGLKEVTPVEIRFIDVGKYGHNDCGESILIKYGDIEVLIDAGDNYSDTFKAVKEVIDSTCQDEVLEYVIATHPDSDHIGSMDDVINTYEVKNIIRFMGDASSNNYKKFDEAVKNEENCNVCTVLDSYNNVGTCSRVITLGDEVFIEIINTQNYEQKENNARSVVCVLNAYGVRTLFTGDADNNSSELEKAYMDTVKDIDILKIVHHGTKNGTTKEFLQAVKPETVIVCNGNYFGNKHGHPTYEAIARVYEYSKDTNVYAVAGGDAENCNVTSSDSYKCEPTDYTLDRNGTILILIDNNGYNVSSEYYNDNPIELRDTHFWKAVTKAKGA